jgi:FkbM family methyltransferase
MATMRTDRLLDLGELHALWVLGDWSRLAELNQTDLAGRSDRQLAVLYALAGCQQCGLREQAIALVEQAKAWGCSREQIARWMVAALLNTLGRAAALAQDSGRSLRAYRDSVGEVSGGVESDELASARAAHQSRLLEADRAAEADVQAIGPSHRKPETGITSYAQNFEDVMLWRALGTVPEGCYVDVGAQDPVIDSVSRAFYERGWRGIHVEPTPAYAQLLREDRPDETVFQAAIAAGPGEMSFFEIPGTGISTGDPFVAREHSARGFGVREITVPTMTLAQVLEAAGDRDIHWLKIDVEAMERVVLDSWGASPRRPWIVVVESTLPLTEVDVHEDWEDLLLQRGYRAVYFDGLNRFYLAGAQAWLAPAFESAPNVFDGFVLSGKASATFCRPAA